MLHRIPPIVAVASQDHSCRVPSRHDPSGGSADATVSSCVKIEPCEFLMRCDGSIPEKEHSMENPERHLLRREEDREGPPENGPKSFISSRTMSLNCPSCPTSRLIISRRVSGKSRRRRKKNGKRDSCKDFLQGAVVLACAPQRSLECMTIPRRVCC